MRQRNVTGEIAIIVTPGLLVHRKSSDPQQCFAIFRIFSLVDTLCESFVTKVQRSKLHLDGTDHTHQGPYPPPNLVSCDDDRGKPHLWPSPASDFLLWPTLSLVAVRSVGVLGGPCWRLAIYPGSVWRAQVGLRSWCQMRAGSVNKICARAFVDKRNTPKSRWLVPINRGSVEQEVRVNSFYWIPM